MKELESEVEFCRRIVKSWEKLRLLYNGALLFPGIVLLWRILHLQAERMAQNPPGMGFPIMDPVTLFISALLFGLCANVCFCLGPYSEFIVIALGFSLTARKIRVLLFSLGLMISLGIIILAWFLVEVSLSFPSPP